MYFDTTIIRENKQIANFEFCPSEELNYHLRSHERIEGGDDWFCIPNLTKSEIAKIHSLCKTEEEKELLEDLQEGDMIDILLHFYIYVKK